MLNEVDKSSQPERESNAPPPDRRFKVLSAKLTGDPDFRMTP